MSVVVVGPLPPPVHGAAKVTAAAAALLREKGVLVQTYDTASTGTGLRYHARRTLQHARAIGRIALDRDVSAVYVGGAGGLGLWYQAGVVLVGRLRDKNLVFHHHSSSYLGRPAAAMSAVVRAGGPHLTHVTLSQQMSESLQALYPGAVRLLHVSNAAFLPELSLPRPRPSADERLVVGHLSNLSMEKGLGEVVASFEALLELGVDAELRLAGPAAGADEQQLIADLKQRQTERVTISGALPPQQVPEFLADLDVFLFPSRYRHEAEPLVVLEAAAAGVPTVAFGVGALPEIVAATGGRAVRLDDPFIDGVREMLAEIERVGSSVMHQQVHSGMRRFRSDHQSALSRLLDLLLE